MRVHTIPPERIRYGRSPAAPAAPPRPATPPPYTKTSRPVARRARRTAQTSTRASVSGFVNGLYSGQRSESILVAENEDSNSFQTIFDSSHSKGVGDDGVDLGGHDREIQAFPSTWDEMEPWEQRRASSLAFASGRAGAESPSRPSEVSECIRDHSFENQNCSSIVEAMKLLAAVVH